MKTIYTITLAAAMFAACGTDQKEREKTTGEQTQITKTQDPIDTNALVEDEEATGQTVTAQIDDAISSAAEDQETETGAGLLLAGTDAKASHDRYRNCTEAEGKATVEIRSSLERSFNLEGTNRSGSTIVKALIEKKRIWSKEGAEMKCAANKKHAIVPWAAIAGVSAEIEFTHNRSRVASVTNKKKNITQSTSFSFEAKGTRSIVWENVESSENGPVLVQKTIKSNVARELNINTKKGETKSISGTVKTDDNSPLITIVEREKDTLKVLSRTIKSGKLIATGKDGGRIETSFDGVKYTNLNRCMATEGKISGAVYEKDATEPKVTFQITFTGDSKTIVFSNGKEAEYAPEGCVFDDPDQVTEHDTKDEVKPVETEETAADSKETEAAPTTESAADA